jgi:hypothetical protein
LPPSKREEPKKGRKKPKGPKKGKEKEEEGISSDEESQGQRKVDNGRTFRVLQQATPVPANPIPGQTKRRKMTKGMRGKEGTQTPVTAPHPCPPRGLPVPQRPKENRWNCFLHHVYFTYSPLGSDSFTGLCGVGC